MSVVTSRPECLVFSDGRDLNALGPEKRSSHSEGPCGNVSLLLRCSSLFRKPAFLDFGANSITMRLVLKLTLFFSLFRSSWLSPAKNAPAKIGKGSRLRLKLLRHPIRAAAVFSSAERTKYSVCSCGLNVSFCAPYIPHKLKD